MRDPKLMQYYQTETAHCDCCDILFFRTLVIGFTVLTTIIGAAIVGLSLVMTGANQHRPEIIEEYSMPLNRITIAMIVIGAIVIIMSIMGCLATVFENTWFTVTFVMILVLCMAGQLSCGILTLFYRGEVREWAKSQFDCETCLEAYETVLEYPTILAIMMLATLGVQLAIIVTACKASRMRKSAKRALLLSEFVPSHDLCDREAKKHCAHAKPEMLDNNNVEDYDVVDGGYKEAYTPSVGPAACQQMYSAKAGRTRPSTSPGRGHRSPSAEVQYEAMESVGEEAVEIH